MSGLYRRGAELAGALLTLLLLSCNTPTDPIVPCLDCFSGPPNNTPENTVLRFIRMYETKNIVEYENLFTGDYRFQFSNSADPTLARKYAAGWSRVDEKIAAQNLFQGGVNSDDVFNPAATTIAVELLPTGPADDTSSGRDPTLYKVLVANVEVRIDIREIDVLYVIGGSPAQSHRFFLVRGDAAQGLTAEQPADSLHWYLHEWRDESGPLKRLGPAENDASTWGRIKALYR